MQLYLAHNNAGFKTPIRTLKGFKRITLKPCETRLITFNLASKEQTEISPGGKVIPMVGNIEVTVGGGQPSPALLAAKKPCSSRWRLVNKHLLRDYFSRNKPKGIRAMAQRKSYFVPVSAPSVFFA